MSIIEFDCETTGLQPWSGSHAAFLWTFYDGQLLEALYPGKDDARIQWWFDRGKTEKLRAWNTKFDRAFACIGGYDIPGDGQWLDGMLTAQAMDERTSAALKARSKALFGEDEDALQKQLKGWLTKERARRKKEAQQSGEELIEPNYSDVPTDIIEPYGLDDVLKTRRVCDHYNSFLGQKPELQRVIDFEHEALDALFAIEKRGLPASEQDYRCLENEVVQNLERMDTELQELFAAGDRATYLRALGKEVEVSEDGSVLAHDGSAGDFNPSSTPQVIAALKARGADLSYMSEKSGKLSADADNLRAVDDDLAAAILEFRSEFKVLGTYVRPMIGRSYVTAMRSWKEPFIASDGRIHTTYRQVGARTGRMSSADPNMQNQHRDDLRLRYNIVADPGHKLVVCDLSNIEMMLFAAYCGEGRMLEAVRAGEDLHTLTAKMLGFRDRKRSGGVYETARQQGKTYNFSRVYGGGLRTIKRQRRCTMEEARLLKRRFDEAYPEVVRLSNRIQYRLEDQGYITDQLVSGRRFRGDPQQDGYKMTNWLVQGTAAALLKYAVIQLHKDGMPMVGLVHDEILAHVPEKEAEDAKRLIIERMTEHAGVRELVPLSAEGDIVDRWSQAKNPLWVPNWAKEAA